MAQRDIKENIEGVAKVLQGILKPLLAFLYVAVPFLYVLYTCFLHLLRTCDDCIRKSRLTANANGP